jgi:hypothetical protein
MGTATPPRSTWASPRRRFHDDAHPIAPTGLAAVYRRRRPTATPLYPIVQHHLETFLARAAEADPWGEGVAGWVEEDFRAYLRCGILPTASPASGATTAPPSASWPSPARAAASAPPATLGAWSRSPLT